MRPRTHCWGKACATAGLRTKTGRRSGLTRRSPAANARWSAIPIRPKALKDLGVSFRHRAMVSGLDQQADWFDEAIDVFDQSLRLRPDDVDTLTEFGICLGQRGDLDEGNAEWFDRAIEVFESASREQPGDLVLLHHLASAHDCRGQTSDAEDRASGLDKAISLYEQALADHPEDAMLLLGLAFEPQPSRNVDRSGRPLRVLRKIRGRLPTRADPRSK